jgi:RimJ/RimL family protein N-acetyltransferase
MNTAPDINYRLSVITDFDSVYDLYMDEISNRFLTYDPMQKPEFIGIFDELLQSNTLYLAEIENEVVGSFRLIPKTYRQEHTVYLGGFVVGHQYKGRGIGAAMLRHIKTFTLEKGMKRIELTVNLENALAIALYKKAGFEIEGLLKSSYHLTDGKYYDEYLMGLVL